MPVLRQWLSLAALAAALALALSGCSADLTIPPDTVITCAGGSCPDGFTCNAKLERCIWNPDIDTVPPALAAPAVLDPTIDVGGVPVSLARAGMLVTVTFTVTEPLRFDPAVTLTLGPGRTRPLALVQKDGLQYVYGYYVTGFDEPEADCPVTIHLEDVQGVEASAGGGSVRFDFRKPTVDVHTLTPSYAIRKDATLSLRLIVSELLGAPPIVTFANDPTTPFTQVAWNGDRTWDFEYTARGTGYEIEGAPGQQLLVTLVDLAENLNEGIPTGAAVFDFTAPSVLAGSAKVDPLAARDGSKVVLTFTASEPLGAAPTVVLGTGVPFAPEPSTLEPPQYVFSHTADKDPPVSDPEGSHFFAITLVDEAGNVASDLPGPAVTFTFTPPAVADLLTCAWDPTPGEELTPCATSQTTFSAQPGFNDVRASFRFVNAPRAVQVQLGTEIIAMFDRYGPTSMGTCVAVNDFGDWTCRLTAYGTPGGEETRNLVVTVWDAALNATADSLTLRYDNLAPSLPTGVRPTVQRCDEYVPAMRGTSIYWLKPLADLAGTQCPYTACDATTARARVYFTVTEPLATDAVSGAQAAVIYMRRTGFGDVPLHVDVCPTGNPLDVVAYFDAEPGAEGPWELVGQVSDAHGNASPLLSLATFEYDATPPAPPLTAPANQVVYTRAPWGTTEAPGEPALHQVLAAPATTAASTTAAPVQAVLLPGRTAATPVACTQSAQTVPYAYVGASDQGAFTCTLPASPTPPAELWVAQEDAAGNRSLPALVHDGTWTAKLGGANRLTQQPYWRPARDTADATAATLPVTTDGLPRFERADEAGTAPDRVGYCAATWVPERGRVLMFGGQNRDNANSYYGQTWLWSGRAWSALGTTGSPSARAAAALAHDRRRGKTVLFGGWNASWGLCDTWELEGTTWTRVLNPGDCDTSTPRGRRGAALFWSETAGTVLLFGGRVPSLSDTSSGMWSWDGSQWLAVPQTTPWPSKRAWALVATDANPASAAHGVTLMVSGTPDLETDAPVTDDLVWRWSGSGWSSHAMPAGAAADFDYRVAQLWYDAAADAFLLFRPSNKKLYAWDDAARAFAEVTPAPAVLGDVAALEQSAYVPCGAYDEERRAFIRFGGCQDATNCEIDTTPAEAHQETFAFAGGAWRQLQPVTRPAARSGAAAAWDPAAGNAFVWGGTGASAPERFDGWRWDGWRWNGGANVGAAGLTGASLAAWGATGPLIRFGGTGAANAGAVASTVTLDAADAGWTLACSATSCGATPTYVEPIPVGELATTGAGQSLAYYEVGAPAVGELLFFRGKKVVTPPPVSGSSTWIGAYDGAAVDPADRVAWTAIDDSAGAPRSTSGHRLTACTPAAGAGAVLFGGHDGTDYLNETWVWSGATHAWSLAVPADGVSPPARADHVQVCDALTRSLVIIGGEGKDAGGNPVPLDDVWAWDGARWTNRTPTPRPPARSGAVGVAGGAPGQALLFGGLDATSPRNDTWIWTGGGDARPAHVFTVPFSGAGVPVSSLQSLRVAWRGGATAQAGGGAALPGIELRVWKGGAWSPTGTVGGAAHDAIPAPPVVPPTWSAVAPFDGYLSGDALDLAVAAVPQGVNGSGVARLRTEHVDVKATYRLCVAAGGGASSAADCCNPSGLVGGVCP